MPPESLEPAPELLPLASELLPELPPELPELLPGRLVETLPELPDPPESKLERPPEPERLDVESEPPSLGVPSAIEPLPCVELDEPHAAMAAGANASTHRAENLVLLSIDWNPVRVRRPRPATTANAAMSSIVMPSFRWGSLLRCEDHTSATSGPSGQGLTVLACS
jgi:hypothetical protein